MLKSTMIKNSRMVIGFALFSTNADNPESSLLLNVVQCLETCEVESEVML